MIKKCLFNNFFKKIKFLFVLLIIIQINGCALHDHKINISIEDYSIEQLYELSKKEINKKNWEAAKYYIKKITADFNTKTVYQDALIDLIYISWKEGKLDESLSQISSFTKIYPRNPRIDYLLYIRGLINSTSDKFIFNFIGKRKISFTKDNKKILSAIKDFNELIEKFPDSKYSAHSRKYIKILNNLLSKNELNIAKYYYDNKLFLAAINHAKEIIEQPNNLYHEEASKIIEESYHIINNDHMSS
ncbi:outer membrane protein assembly factor BamD [Candidatus Kinetoplastidibacterium galati]|nr:outer membrane protein assembly factor BamD [Candidatus Kinetoplastibacterium galatii]